MREDGHRGVAEDLHGLRVRGIGEVESLGQQVGPRPAVRNFRSVVEVTVVPGDDRLPAPVFVK